MVVDGASHTQALTVDRWLIAHGADCSLVYGGGRWGCAGSLSESFAECEREDGKALSEPAGPREGLGSIYEDVAAQLEAQISSEASHTPADRPSLSAATVPAHPKHAAAVGPNGSFQYARLLLSHLGYLLPTGMPTTPPPLYPPPRPLPRPAAAAADVCVVCSLTPAAMTAAAAAHTGGPVNRMC